MKFDPSKDLYAILGVGQSASLAEITQAFKVRTRILHPDRFDRNTQSLQWEEANEMQTDLNIAFQVLRNQRLRDLYDEFKGVKKTYPKDATSRPKASAQQPPVQKKFVRPNFTPFTECLYSDLPTEAKNNLKSRQRNKNLDQVQINTAPILGPIIQTLICCFLFWLVYLAANSTSYNELWIMYLCLSGIGAYFGVSGIDKIQRHYRSEIRPFFYLTPLHLIKTDYNHVCIWPLCDVKEKNSMDHYHNGSFNGRTVTFHFKTGFEQIRINSRKQIDDFSLKYEKFANAWNNAVKNSNLAYFNEQNDLHSLTNLKIPTNKPEKTNKIQTLVWTVFATITVFVAGLFINNAYTKSHPLPPVEKSRPAQRASVPRSSYNSAPKKAAPPILPAYPEQTLPANGYVVRFTSRYPKAPFKVDNSQGDHALIKLVDASTGEDALTVFVRAGSIVEIEVPLGTYEARYATGETWYGYTYNFGPSTAYSKADRYLDFSENETVYGTQVSGCEITLYKVMHGNLSTSRIQASQF